MKSMSENLENLCDKEDPRLINPFNIGYYTYAGDSVIMLRVHKIDKYKGNKGINNIEIFFEGIEDRILESNMIKLNDLNLSIVPTKCCDCDGIGKITFYSSSDMEYTVDCELCEGNLIINRKESINIGNKIFDKSVLNKLLCFENVKIYEKEDFKNTAPFSFDGGVGLVCKLRCKYPHEE